MYNLNMQRKAGEKEQLGALQDDIERDVLPNVIKSEDDPGLSEIFPNASQSTLEANPQLSTSRTKKTQPGATSARRRGNMNKTEAEFALILEGMKCNGEISRYEFEGITVSWANMKYTPDFVVFYTIFLTSNNPKEMLTNIKLIEVKGAHIWDRDIVRFKGARAYWPEFAFEMHQKMKDGWKQKF